MSVFSAEYRFAIGNGEVELSIAKALKSSEVLLGATWRQESRPLQDVRAILKALVGDAIAHRQVVEAIDAAQAAFISLAGELRRRATSPSNTASSQMSVDACEPAPSLTLSKDLEAAMGQLPQSDVGAQVVESVKRRGLRPMYRSIHMTFCSKVHNRSWFVLTQ